jgi:DNA-binding MarR family transcriptional regulator
MTGRRLSKLQKRILFWLDAEERRTDRIFSSSHQKLVQALPNAKGNISHSLRLLEAHGLVEIGRSPGGQAENVRLTLEGCQKASELAGSYD